MNDDDDIMTAEEFFGEIDAAETRPCQPRSPRGRKPGMDLFSKIKESMVMRVYGVSHDKAKKIIAERNRA